MFDSDFLSDQILSKIQDSIADTDTWVVPARSTKGLHQRLSRMSSNIWQCAQRDTVLIRSTLTQVEETVVPS